jgi:hypothetical protein
MRTYVSFSSIINCPDNLGDYSISLVVGLTWNHAGVGVAMVPS